MKIIDLLQNEKLSLFRELGKKTPIIVLTDSDGAGKLIRSHLTTAIPKDRLIQLYIPKIKGTEKRKSVPSAEGTLGVEGMERKLLFDLLLPFETEDGEKRMRENPISKTDFYNHGFSGGADSRAKRDALAEALGLPTGMTANALLEAVRILVSYEEYLSIATKM